MNLILINGKIARKNKANSFIATNTFGNNTDYVEINSSGNISLHGAATQFDDILGDITKLKVVGVGISENSAENGIDMLTSANLSDYVYANFQLSHRWKSGSTINPHIHFEQSENKIPNFLIRYRWQKNGGTKVTSWSGYKCNTAAFSYSSGTLNQIVHGTGITPSTSNISDIIELRIFRDNGNNSGLFTGADTYSTSAMITSVDIHFEADSIGSNTEYTK